MKLWIRSETRYCQNDLNAKYYVVLFRVTPLCWCLITTTPIYVGYSFVLQSVQNNRVSMLTMLNFPLNIMHLELFAN